MAERIRSTIIGRIEIQARLMRVLSVTRKVPENKASGSSQRKSG